MLQVDFKFEIFGFKFEIFEIEILKLRFLKKCLRPNPKLRFLKKHPEIPIRNGRRS